MPAENQQNGSPIPAPDPLGVAEAATDGGVRDLLKITADNMAEFSRQAAIASAERDSEGTQPAQEQTASEPAQRRETDSNRVVRRGTGESVQTIL
jgi:hypothetical protein